MYYPKKGGFLCSSCHILSGFLIIALRYAVWREKHTRNAFPVVIPEEKISQTPILPYEMLSWRQLSSSKWEHLDVTACWLPEEALPFQQNRSGCRMFNWASVTLGKTLYSCTKQSRSLQNHTSTKKNGQQKGCLQCIAFFPKSFLSKDNDVYLWRSLYCCPEIAHICGTPGLAMRKQPTFG